MVNRREICIISLDDKKKIRKTYGLISLCISVLCVLLLFLPCGTVGGISMGSIINGNKYSNVYGLICTAITITVFVRIFISAFVLALLKMEMPERREKNYFAMNIVSCTIHAAVYFILMIFWVVYIDSQAAYFNADTTWLKIACFLIFFPHGVIRELISYLTLKKSGFKYVETSASSFNAKAKRFLVWKFVPGLLAVIVFLFMMPAVSPDIYYHKEVYAKIQENLEFKTGNEILENKMIIEIDGEAIPVSTTTPYVRMGGNYRMFEDMIKEREEKLATANGGAKTALENEIKALKEASLKIVPSYEIVTFSSSRAGRVAIASYTYNAHDTKYQANANDPDYFVKLLNGTGDIENKEGKASPYFVDSLLNKKSIKLGTYNYNIYTNRAKDPAKPEHASWLDFSLVNNKNLYKDFTSYDVLVTVTYSDGSMYEGFAIPANADYLNEKGYEVYNKKYVEGDKDYKLNEKFVYAGFWAQFEDAIVIR